MKTSKQRPKTVGMALGLVGLISILATQTVLAAQQVRSQKEIDELEKQRAANVFKRAEVVAWSAPRLEPYIRAVSDAGLAIFPGLQQKKIRRDALKIDVVNKNTQGGFLPFCAGLSDKSPDILILGRRMTRAEFDECRSNGVDAIIAVELGKEAAILAVSEGSAIDDIELEQVALGVAEKIIGADGPKKNVNQSWDQVDVNLPAQPIRF